jgi:hypothetical protein
MKDAQKAINMAVEWAKEMGVEFNEEKTVVMLFTNKRSSSYQMPKGLKIYGQEIPFSKTAKYLGVTLDDKLSWKPHIENKIKTSSRPGYGRRTLMRLLMKMSGRRTTQSRFPQKRLTCYPAAT